MRRPRRGLVAAGAMGLLAAMGAASLGSPRGRQWLAHEYGRVNFHVIADRVTQEAADPEAAVLELLAYVHDHVILPPEAKPVGDVEPIEILASGRGYCDQQANVFLQLARTVPVDGRLVFLRDGEGISRHAVAEVWLDGAWRVMDPLWGLQMRTAAGELVTREDLAQDSALLTQHPAIRVLSAMGAGQDFTAMASWYQQPPTIFNTWRGKRKAWLARAPRLLQRVVGGALQEAYLALSSRGMAREAAMVRRARHYALLGRRPAAERLFRRAIRQARDPQVRQDAAYFLGCFYEAQGRFDEALAAFGAVIQDDANGHGWSRVAAVAMGRIYDARGQRRQALAAYEASGMSREEARVAERLTVLRQQMAMMEEP